VNRLSAWLEAMLARLATRPLLTAGASMLLSLLGWLRSSKYLNNLIALDHRGVKLRFGPMLGLKRFRTAAIVIAGIELLRRIRKEQFNLTRLRLKDRPAPAVWDAVLAAQCSGQRQMLTSATCRPSG
jgi:transposase-like protein